MGKTMLDVLKDRLIDGLEIVKVKETNNKYAITFRFEDNEAKAGPRKAVAAELTKLLINGAIKFIPYQDEFSKPTDG